MCQINHEEKTKQMKKNEREFEQKGNFWGF